MKIEYVRDNKIFYKNNKGELEIKDNYIKVKEYYDADKNKLLCIRIIPYSEIKEVYQDGEGEKAIIIFKDYNKYNNIADTVRGINYDVNNLSE